MKTVSLLLAAALAVSPIAADAKGKGKAKGHHKGAKHAHKAQGPKSYKLKTSRGQVEVLVAPAVGAVLGALAADAARADSRPARQADLTALAPMTSPLPRPSTFDRVAVSAVPQVEETLVTRSVAVPTTPLASAPDLTVAAPDLASVGETLPENYRTLYKVLDNPGLFGLPPLDLGLDYVRAGETAMVVERGTRVVRDTLPLGAVVIR